MRQIVKIAAAAIVVLALTSFTGAFAHDSNTLHKIGKAIQYPVRKAGENASIDVHRGLGHKSVEHDRRHNARYVVEPSGAKVYKGPNVRHRHHHHVASH